MRRFFAYLVAALIGLLILLTGEHSIPLPAQAGSPRDWNFMVLVLVLVLVVSMLATVLWALLVVVMPGLRRVAFSYHQRTRRDRRG